ncbi:MAG: helix-turn-helix domain-containing protein [Propionicimonas sp.]|jgi:transcriptional regulator with XRE-family HTH domain
MSTDVVRSEFTQLVNEARLARHLSIRAVARLAGVPATTAQGWLSGKHFPCAALRANYLSLIAHLGLMKQLPEELRAELEDGPC